MMPTKDALCALFSRIDTLRVGVLGDFCLDLYWHADMKKSVLSRETPHFPLPIVRERISPGGAGNVACNIAALEPASVTAIGVLGSDFRGDLLEKSLEKSGVDTENLLRDETRFTNTYIKPLRMGISETVYEDPRLDFENYHPLAPETQARLLSLLDRAAAALDVLCVCDQMAFGCVTPAVREKLAALGRAGLPILVDSRDRVACYESVIVKPNEVEACRALELPDSAQIETLCRAAEKLAQKTGRPAFVTIGEKGCIVCADGRCEHVAAVPVSPPIDICGAGDTFMSMLACALAAGLAPAEAARCACLASSVTVKKLRETGTASRDELLRAAAL